MNWFKKHKKEKVKIDDECKELTRDSKITELAYLLKADGLDSILPYLYGWNLENIDDLIFMIDIHRRLDWIAASQLNGFYSSKDLIDDNLLLEEHDIYVLLPSNAEILRYRIGVDNAESGD